jgi:hypothetical protein
VGITFEVFFKAMQERNRQLGISIDDFNGMTWDNLFDFALNWFVRQKLFCNFISFMVML